MAAVAIPTLVVSVLQGVGTAADATVVTGSDQGSAFGREVAVRNKIERRLATSSSTETSTSTTEVVTTTIVTTTEAPTTTAAPSTTAVVPTTIQVSSPPVQVAAPTPTPTPAPTPPPPVAAPAPQISGDLQAILACIRRRESGGNYQIVSSNGLYHGAYQFLQSSWDSTARHAGRGDLVGIPPERVSPADQDAMAIALYQWQGSRPWGGACG